MLKNEICSPSVPDLSSYSQIRWFSWLLDQEHSVFEWLLEPQDVPCIIATSWNTLVQRNNQKSLERFKRKWNPVSNIYLQIRPREAIRRILSDNNNLNDRFSNDFQDTYWIEWMISAIFRKTMQDDQIFLELADVVIDAAKSISSITDEILKHIQIDRLFTTSSPQSHLTPSH